MNKVTFDFTSRPRTVTRDTPFRPLPHPYVDPVYGPEEFEVRLRGVNGPEWLICDPNGAWVDGMYYASREDAQRRVGEMIEDAEG